MKRIQVILLLLVSTQALFSQRSRTIYGLNAEDPTSPIFAEPSGNKHLIVGSHSSGYFLSMLDDTLEFLWAKQYGGPELILTDLDAIPGKHIFITGYKETTVTTGFCAKLDEKGDTIWTKGLEFSGYDMVKPLCITATRDSGVVVGLMLAKSDSALGGGALAKLDKAGTMVWSRVYSINSKAISLRCIRELSDSSFIAMGSIASTTSEKAIMPRFSSTGMPLLTLQSDNHYGLDICVTDSLVYGYLLDRFSLVPVIFKMSLQGNMQSVRSFTNLHGSSTPPVKDRRQKINKINGGLIFEVGEVALEIDNDLKVVWSKGEQQGHVNAYQTPNGNFWLVHQGPGFGIRSQFPHSMIGIYQLHGSFGCGEYYLPVTNTSVSLALHQQTLVSQLSGSAVAYQLEPGQFATVTRPGCVDFYSGINEGDKANGINLFPVPADNNLSLKHNIVDQQFSLCRVYSLLGKEIKSLMLEFSDGQAELNCTDIPTGVYMLRLGEGSSVIYRKIAIRH